MAKVWQQGQQIAKTLTSKGLGCKNGAMMKLQSIQLLRALAALLVVFFHLRMQELAAINTLGSIEKPLLNGVVTNGYAGVDLFFVISGFIMVYVTQNLKPGAATAADFLFARLTRVYPVWWVFAALALILLMTTQLALPGGNGWDRIARGTSVGPFLLKSFLLIPQDVYPILSIGWTLIHEVYFYIVFALILLLPRSWWLTVLFAWGCIVALGGMIGQSTHMATGFINLIFYPMTMEFIIGAAIGLAVISGFAKRAGIVSLAATLWFVGALACQGPETEAALGWGRVIWFGLPSALLVYAFAVLELNKRLIWLIPAAIGAIVATAFYQMYNLTGDSPANLRIGGSILSVIVGLIAMLVTIWGGWLTGQHAPEKFVSLAPRFQAILRRLVRLGDWSFSLYLCHVIVIVALRAVFNLLGKIDALAPLFQIGHAGPLDNILFYGLGLSLSIVLAGLAYRFIEKPMIQQFGLRRQSLFHKRSSGEDQV